MAKANVNPKVSALVKLKSKLQEYLELIEVPIYKI